MKIKELIKELEKYPPEKDLNDIAVHLQIGRENNRIMYAYLCNQRICGTHPWGNYQLMSKQLFLEDVAKGLITGLKLNI